MRIFQRIAALLRKGDIGFSALEMKVLQEAERQLDAGRAERLRNRIDSINLVQRIDGGREVNAYAMKGGKPTFDQGLRLVDQPGERRLAKFSFTGSNGFRYSGSAWLVDGQFFSMQFNNITEHVLDDVPEDMKVDVLI